MLVRSAEHRIVRLLPMTSHRYAGWVHLVGLTGHADWTKPIPQWKRKLFIEIGQPACRFLLKILGFWVKQTGDPSVCFNRVIILLL